MMEGHPEAYRAALARHHAILREAVEARQGFVFETLGDGIYAAFEHSTTAVEAAPRRAAGSAPGGVGARRGPCKVRMGLHTGEVELWGEHYFGPPLYRCGRLMALAHGGQVLLSEITADLVRDSLPTEAALQALGEHQLRDLLRPEPVYQLLHPQLPASFPPLRTLQRRPNNLPAWTTPFIGREAGDRHHPPPAPAPAGRAPDHPPGAGRDGQDPPGHPGGPGLPGRLPGRGLLRAPWPGSTTPPWWGRASPRCSTCARRPTAPSWTGSRGPCGTSSCC